MLRHAFGIAASAPRYSIDLLDAVGKLDDERLPIAEICRRLADHAGELGLTRPSYVHMRRLVHQSRERRAAARELRDDVLGASLAGRVVNPVGLADRIRELPPGVGDRARS